MPAHRHPSTTRSHPPAPYKASFIVISSDDDEEPVSQPKRSRKPRRSRPEGDVLEIFDEPTVKLEEQEVESLKRRCHELEQERDVLRKDNRRLTVNVNQLKANTRQNTLNISALDEAICCEVCTHTMWSPYLLTNCGHTFCQGCLTDWFSTTIGHHRQSGGRGLPPYTCPSCRDPVRTPPIQNFSLKRIARLAAESRGESSPRRPHAQPPPMLPHRMRGGARRDHHSGPFDAFFGR